MRDLITKFVSTILWEIGIQNLHPWIRKTLPNRLSKHGFLYPGGFYCSVIIENRKLFASSLVLCRRNKGEVCPAIVSGDFGFFYSKNWYLWKKYVCNQMLYLVHISQISQLIDEKIKILDISQFAEGFINKLTNVQPEYETLKGFRISKEIHFLVHSVANLLP